MPKKENSKHYSVEVQKGPIRTDQPSSLAFFREPERTMTDMEHLSMRQDMRTLTLHTPKQ